MHRHSPRMGSVLTARRVLYLLLMLLLLYGVLPQSHIFLITAQDLQNIQPRWIALAIGALAASYACSAGIYYLLSQRRLPYGRTVVVQMAATFADRLLPAGSGALGVNYLFLRKQKQSPGRALALVATNNLLGLVGHSILLTILVTFFSRTLHTTLKITIPPWQWAVAAGVLVGTVVVALIVLPRLRGRVQRTAGDALRTLVGYYRQPFTIIGALALAMCLTLAYVICLYAAGAAIGTTLSPQEAFLVLTVGVAAGTIIATPGGLGSAEVGLTAGLVSFGIPSHSALITALLYRLITFWLALLVGAVAFVYLEQHNDIQFPRSQSHATK